MRRRNRPTQTHTDRDILDGRGGVLGTRTFKVSGDGHRAMTAWAGELGQVRTWGVEGASSLGRHTAVFLGEVGFGVRDVCPTRIAEQARRRRQGKTDNLDAERIAREVLAHDDLPAAKSAAELLVENGDPRRFTEGGYARFNGTAPIPASSGEGDGEPVRHRLDQGGNRQINAVLHRMAITQLRCNPAARDLYERARKRGHTKREAMRILKRHLSNATYRTMLRDTLRPEKSEEIQQAA